MRPAAAPRACSSSAIQEFPSGFFGVICRYVTLADPVRMGGKEMIEGVKRWIRPLNSRDGQPRSPEGGRPGLPPSPAPAGTAYWRRASRWNTAFDATGKFPIRVCRPFRLRRSGWPSISRTRIRAPGCTRNQVRTKFRRRDRSESRRRHTASCNGMSCGAAAARRAPRAAETHMEKKTRFDWNGRAAARRQRLYQMIGRGPRRDRRRMTFFKLGCEMIVDPEVPLRSRRANSARSSGNAESATATRWRQARPRPYSIPDNHDESGR